MADDDEEDGEKETTGSDWPGPRIGRKSRARKSRRKMAKAAKKGAKKAKRRKKK